MFNQYVGVGLSSWITPELEKTPRSTFAFFAIAARGAAFRETSRHNELQHIAIAKVGRL